MPADRQAQIISELETLAEINNISEHPNVIHMQGTPQGWFRLSVGNYRAVLQPRKEYALEILYVDFIGPRGDAYRD